MNSTQIKCFLTVARLRSFSLASEELYTSQPSVSRYISQLEQEWGVSLFVRGGKALRLTPQGEDYYQLCLRMEQEFSDLRCKHQSQQQPSLSLRYSVFPAWNISKLLYKNAEHIHQNHPDWDISLNICQANDLVRTLRDGGVDLIFTLGGVLAGQDDLATATLLELPQIILYSQQGKLANRLILEPKDLQGEDFLFVADEVLTIEMIRRQARSVEKRYGFPPKVRLLRNIDELSLALETGQGVALMDCWSRYKSDPMLTYFTIDLPLPVVLAWRREDHNPFLQAFVAETRSFFCGIDKNTLSKPHSNV